MKDPGVRQNRGAADEVFEILRRRMVDVQLRAHGLTDERVLSVLTKVPRHEFVPAHELYRAYEDGPLPIGFDQTISQPYIVAFMTNLLELRPEDKVLEIGTGSGYQTAVLAELCREVYTVERIADLSREAQMRLKRLGYHNIFFKIGDGAQGWPEKAPFDKIISTAAPVQIPSAFAEQLREGGVLVIPVGGHNQELMKGVKQDEVLKTVKTIAVRFVPLQSKKNEDEKN